MSEPYFVVYELTPPPEMKREDFVGFVQEEVFPAVKMMPTRAGMIVELHLLATDATDMYIWLIKWVEGFPPDTLLSGEIADARQKLESSGALVSAPSEVYYEVATRVNSA